MDFLHQRHLSSTEKGTLCLQRLERDLDSLEPTKASQPSVIDTLPNELLVQILQHAAFYGNAHRLVSKRWRKAADSSFWELISCGDHNGVARLATYRRCFDQRPWLRTLPRTMRLSLDKASYATINDIAALLNVCSGIRTLGIHSFSIEIEPILEAAGRLPKLESITIQFRDLTYSGTPIQIILHHLKRSPLKSVSLYRYGLGELLSPYTRWGDNPPHPSQAVLNATRVLFKSGCADIRSVSLNEPYGAPAITAILLTWPKALEHLSIYSLNSARYWHDKHDMQRILNVQRSSLRNIQIGRYGGRTPDNSVPDFSLFMSLEKLAMSIYNLLRETPNSAALKMTAPKLRHIVGDFCTEDQHPASPDAFGEAETKWLEDLASHKRKGEKLSALVNFEIQYHPSGPDYYGEEDVPWPWNRFSEVEAAISDAGVQLLWSPKWSEEEWMMLVEKAKEPETDEEEPAESVADESAAEEQTASSQGNHDIREYLSSNE